MANWASREEWLTLREIIGVAVGILIIVSAAIGVIFIAQSLGASGYPLITIEVAAALVAALIISGALR